VHQGADHIFLVAAVPVSPGGGLKGVLQPGHGEPAAVVGQHVQVGDEAVRKGLVEGGAGPADGGPVLFRGLHHGVELRLVEDFTVSHVRLPQIFLMVALQSPTCQLGLPWQIAGPPDLG